MAVPIPNSRCLLSMLWSPRVARSSCIGTKRNVCFEALPLIENVDLFSENLQWGGGERHFVVWMWEGPTFHCITYLTDNKCDHLVLLMSLTFRGRKGGSRFTTGGTPVLQALGAVTKKDGVRAVYQYLVPVVISTHEGTGPCCSAKIRRLRPAWLHHLPDENVENDTKKVLNWTIFHRHFQQAFERQKDKLCK